MPNITAFHEISGTPSNNTQVNGFSIEEGVGTVSDFNDAMRNMLSIFRVAFPAGLVFMWSGSVATIPQGYYLCDGQNGTPDLRNKFIVGAGDDHDPGDGGGADSITLSTDNLPAHTHNVNPPQTATSSNGGHSHTASSATAGNHGHSASTGSAGSHSHSGSTSSAGSHGHAASTNSAGSHTHTGSALSAGSHTHALSANQASDTQNGGGSLRLNGLRNGSDGNNDATSGASGTHSHSLSIVAGGTHAHSVSVATGGTHSHTVSTNSTGSHTHTVSVASAGSHNHAITVNSAADHSHTIDIAPFDSGSVGAGVAIDNRPAFYALAFIMLR